MSTRYILHPEYDLYFITQTVVGWVDVFTRTAYRNLIYASWEHCQSYKGLQIHAYVIMSNHIHMIVSTTQVPLKDIFRDMKKYTSKLIVSTIEENWKESRRKWMVSMFRFAGRTHPNRQTIQFWQQKNRAIPLWTEKVIRQKLNYIHRNPVKAGWVEEPWHYLHSSARQYAGMEGRVEISFL